jgi:DNA repair protein RadC
MEDTVDLARPRERAAARGVEHLRDSELCTLLIGTGSRGRPVTTVATDVVALLDRSNGVPNRSELEAVEGLGPAKTSAILAAFEIARRVLLPSHRRIRMPVDLLPLVQHFIDRPQEYFLSVSLNGAHEVIALRVVSIGLVNRTVVHPREVFAPAITDRATAVMVAHNHPSGSLEPSGEDFEVTRRLVAAGQTIGIPVLDHIIFSANGYYSFLERGEL